MTSGRFVSCGPLALRLMRTVMLPLLAGFLAFVFRLASSTDLTNDHYLSLTLSQQMLFGALPGRDFVDPGMPLTVVLSALPQLLWPGPFAEVVLCSTMLGLAAAATCAAADRISGSILVALTATAFEVGLQPRLYSYPKILVPAVAVLLIVRYAQTPSRPRLALVGLWTVIGALFRHDLGVYITAGALTAIVVRQWRPWSRTLTDLGLYILACALAAAPYLAYVQWAEGVQEHTRRGVEFAKSEEVFKSMSEWPALPWLDKGGPWSFDDATTLLFYAVHLVAVAVLAGAILRRRSRPVTYLAASAAVLTILAGYLAVVLRHPIAARLPDLAAVLALAWACAVGDPLLAVFRPRGIRRTTACAGLLIAVVSAVAVGGSIWVLSDLDEDLDNGGFYAGWRGVAESVEDARQRGTEWPWTRAWPRRELPQAVRYVNACTEPNDALLITWRAPEYNFFARRRFSAGHVEFLAPNAFATDVDQAQMLAWLEQDRIPIVLINETERGEFVQAYPRVDEWIRARYDGIDRFTVYDGSEITIARRKGLRARAVWGEANWPCQFESPPS